ncbi:hypothetical protein, partial [Bradyrhizobium sp. 23AC]
DENDHGAGKNCDQSCRGNACPSVNSRKSCGKRNEIWQRVDSKDETQPAEQADAKHIEGECDDKHGGGSATKDMTHRAFHHHGATRIIAQNAALCECVTSFVESDKNRSFLLERYTVASENLH